MLEKDRNIITWDGWSPDATGKWSPLKVDDEVLAMIQDGRLRILPGVLAAHQIGGPVGEFVPAILITAGD